MIVPARHRLPVIWKLTVRVATSRRSGQRARAMFVIASVSLFTAAVWSAAGFWSASHRNEVRDAARSPVMSFDGGNGLPVVGDGLPILNGRQFQIMWFAASGEPPPREFNGVTPGRGAAFVAPALLRDVGGAGAFARRFGLAVDPNSSKVSWNRILAFADEYLAFATLPVGRDLPPRSRLLGFDADVFHAAPPAPPRDLSNATMPTGRVAVPYYVDQRVPKPTQALVASLLLLVIPATVTLVSGVSSRSELRARRREALAALGAGGRRLSSFDAGEMATLSVPTAAVVSLAAWVVLGRLTALPAGTVKYLSGDFRPTPAAAVVAATAVLAVPVLMGLAAPRVAAWRAARRVRLARRTGPALVLLPVVVAAIAAVVPTELRYLPFLAVTASVVAVVPRISTTLMTSLGDLVGTGSPTRLIASRRLQCGDPRPPALMRMATFSVVIVVVVSAMNLAAFAPAKESGLPRGIVTVSITGGAPSSSVAALSDRVPDVPIGVVTPGRVFIDGCEQLAVLIGQPPGACATGADQVLSVASASPLSQLGQVVIGTPAADARITTLIARVDSERRNEALQASASGLLGPTQVLGWDRLGPNPIVGWVSTLGLGAVLLLGAALVLQLANTVRFPSASDQALLRLAVSQRSHRATLRWEHHVALAAAVAIGAGYGLLINSAGQPAQITRVEQLPIAIAAMAVWAITAVAVDAALGAVARTPRMTTNPATGPVRTGTT